MRVLGLSLIVLSIFGSGCKKLQALSKPDVTNGREITGDKHPEVVALYRMNVGDETERFSCTGTFLTDTILITAGHCANGEANEKGFVEADIIERHLGKAPLRLFRNPAYNDSLYNAEADLALFIFPEGLSKGVAAIGRKPAQKGNDIVIVGFGRHDSEDPETSGTKRIGFNKVSEVTEGLIRFEGQVASNNNTGADAASAKGDSGGPLFIDDKLVGITTGGYVNKGRKISNYVDLHSEHAKAFFKKALEEGIPVPLPLGYFE